MRAEEQTGRHLLLAVVTMLFSGLLSVVTAVLGWEFWMIILMAVGCCSVWVLHIARIGSDSFYENLSAGLLLTEFFYFSVHETSLFDIPAVACILILALFMLNKKWILHMILSLYALGLLYHTLILHTISRQMQLQEIFHLGLGLVVTISGAALARYWINRRNVQIGRASCRERV